MIAVYHTIDVDYNSAQKWFKIKIFAIVTDLNSTTHLKIFIWKFIESRIAVVTDETVLYVAMQLYCNKTF